MDSGQSSVPEALPIVYLARHGETAWSRSGQHTGRTDLPLTPRGESNARRLGERLRPILFSQVYTSPLQRATRTCELAGYGSVARMDPDLVEWDYGDYEGLTSAEIHARRPGWSLFRDGCPGGESPAAIGARADRVLARIRPLPGNTLLFSSGHFLRTLAARWLGLAPEEIGPNLVLTTASLSALGFDQTRAQPAIRLWNDDHHADV